MAEAWAEITGRLVTKSDPTPRSSQGSGSSLVPTRRRPQKRPVVNPEVASALAEIRMLFKVSVHADPDAEDARLQAYCEALASVDPDDLREAGRRQALVSNFWPSVAEMMGHVRDQQAERRPVNVMRRLPEPVVSDVERELVEAGFSALRRALACEDPAMTRAMLAEIVK